MKRSERSASVNNPLQSSSLLTAATDEVGMVLQLADGKIQACNQAAEKILGFTLEQIQGHDSLDRIWQTIHEDGSPFPGETHPVTIALSTGQPVLNIVMGLYRPSGELIWIKVDGQPLFQMGETTPWAAIATFRDITAQRSTIAAPPQRPTAVSRQRTILIIDDCAEDRETYRRYLDRDDRFRYRILQAETGQEALELCTKVEFDAVLLDYCLPDYEGLELLHTLTVQIPHIPIVLVTGQGTETLAVQTLKAGAEDYLVKGDLTAATLQTAIAEVIEKTELRFQVQQGQERERLVAQVSQQIRQSLDLSTILDTTVEEVRRLFQTDRVLIFRFHADGSGTVIAESVGAEWNSVLSATLLDPCLAATYMEQYQQGRVSAIADIHTADVEPCHVTMLAAFQVQANLVAPILQGNHLWGLLIAHHCRSARSWQTSEIELLKQLSTQVGTAIQQAELYQQARTELAERQRIEAVLKQGSDRIRLLYEAVKDLLVSTQPLTLIESLFHNLSKTLELDLCLNYLLETPGRDPDCSRLHLVSYFGLEAEVAERWEWIELGQGICGVAAQQRRQIVKSNIQQSNEPELAVLRNMGIMAYASQPLIAQGKLFGTLAFGSYRRSHFSKAETELLQALCDQIAIALERANLVESLQQQTEQLRQADRLKDEFLAVLSHELRTPLNPILGWTRLLQSRTFDEPQMIKALATIERNAKLQSQLIEDLLDISRIMRGKLTLNAAPISFASVIFASLETVRLAAEAKHIQIETTIDDRVQQIYGDSGRLQQVVWNLLSNAVKFTDTAGQIEVRLSQVNDQVQLQVIDTGKGIDPSFAPYVFEYFRQEDGSTTRKFGGLGLGLAIARQIIELHGGTIWAESAGEGLGATFTVQIPGLSTIASPISSNPVATSFTFPLAGVRVLVVDDDVDTGDLLTFLLEDGGAIVTVVRSAREALQILDRAMPDILLSDIGMPEMNGYELIRTIRSSDRGQNLPAIAITAYAGELNQQSAIAAGFQHHVSKPIHAEFLITLVRELVHADLEGV